MIAPEMLGCESARLHQRHGQRVSQRQRTCSGEKKKKEGVARVWGGGLFSPRPAPLFPPPAPPLFAPQPQKKLAPQKGFVCGGAGPPPPPRAPVSPRGRGGGEPLCF